MKWLAGTLGFSEPHMRKLLRTKTPPGFVRSKGDHWVVKGPITAGRLAGLRRLYGVPEPPEMTMQTLEAFDTSYAEFVRWSRGVDDAEKVAEAHPFFGPIYRKFKSLEKELSITPAELVTARRVILDEVAATPLDKQFWEPSSNLVAAFQRRNARGGDFLPHVREFPRKFKLIAALQKLAARSSAYPTRAQLAHEMGIERSTLFRWVRQEGYDISLVIRKYFPRSDHFESVSLAQAKDLRMQAFGRRRDQWD